MRQGLLHVALVLLWIGLTHASLSQVVAQNIPVPERYGGETQDYAAQFNDVISELNGFWSSYFGTAGLEYRAPSVITLDGPTVTACGDADPSDFAFYCPRDETIYYTPSAFASHRLRFGDFAPIVVMAHEWGHHIQRLLSIEPSPGNAFELQADCLAGAYSSNAGQQGLLDPGDVTEAVSTSADAGDPLGLPQDAPGAHGINDDRVIAFMRGYLDGVTGCNLPLAPPPQTPVPLTKVARTSDPSLLSHLPSTLDLPRGSRSALRTRASSFEDLVAGLPTRRTRGSYWSRGGGRRMSIAPMRPMIRRPTALAGSRSVCIASPPRMERPKRCRISPPRVATALGFEPVDVGLFADQTEAMTGQADNGDELIIYARRGNLGVPCRRHGAQRRSDGDVFEALLVPLRPLADDPEIVSPELFDVLPDVSSTLPGLILSENHARSAGTVAETFPDVAEAEALFQTWGWRESAARVFTGNTSSGTTRVEVSVFQFQDGPAAAEALPYFLDARAGVLGLAEVTAPSHKG